MESFKKGGKVKKPKPQKKKIVKRKPATTRQIAKGKGIAQFKGTGAQVIVKMPSERREARERFRQHQADASMTSILPAVMALQHGHQSKVEELISSRNLTDAHIAHAEAKRAGYIGSGHSLAAGDQSRRIAELARARRQTNLQLRHEGEEMRGQPMVAESRELRPAMVEEQARRLTGLRESGRNVESSTSSSSASAWGDLRQRPHQYSSSFFDGSSSESSGVDVSKMAALRPRATTTTTKSGLRALSPKSFGGAAAPRTEWVAAQQKKEQAALKRLPAPPPRPPPTAPHTAWRTKDPWAETPSSGAIPVGKVKPPSSVPLAFYGGGEPVPEKELASIGGAAGAKQKMAIPVGKVKPPPSVKVIGGAGAQWKPLPAPPPRPSAPSGAAVKAAVLKLPIHQQLGAPITFGDKPHAGVKSVKERVKAIEGKSKAEQPKIRIKIKKKKEQDDSPEPPPPHTPAAPASSSSELSEPSAQAYARLPAKKATLDNLIATSEAQLKALQSEAKKGKGAQQDRKKATLQRKIYLAKRKLKKL